MKTSRPKLERWLANPANQGKEPEGVLADLEEALRFTLSDAIQIYEKGGGTLTGEDLDVVLKWGLDGSGTKYFNLHLYHLVGHLSHFREA